MKKERDYGITEIMENKSLNKGHFDHFALKCTYSKFVSELHFAVEMYTSELQ